MKEGRGARTLACRVETLLDATTVVIDPDGGGIATSGDAARTSACATFARVIVLICLAVFLCGCAEPGVEPGLKAIVGGSVEPSLDAERIPYAVIVIAAGKIRAIGPQATTPVPKGAETIAAKGKLVRPMPYDAKLAAGSPADLMLFDAETGAPERIMRDGEWVG